MSAPVAFYNEIDPGAAAWLRELIARGLIAHGVVDERSIEDIEPAELAGFVQCHFFAGIGVWSYALRRAGWPDDRPVWTGSCPCQPFSAAGKGGGVADERHLWPAWFWLIEHVRPGIVFGEQVASADGLGWLDLVSADLEGSHYAFGAADLCAAGFGAPHIRQRLFFAGIDRLEYAAGERRIAWRSEPSRRGSVGGCGAGGMGHAFGPGLEGPAGDDGRAQGRPEPGGSAAPASLSHGLADAGCAGSPQQRGRWVESARPSPDRAAGGMADTECFGRNGRRASETRNRAQILQPIAGLCEAGRGRPGPIHRCWRSADWLLCRDGRWRPVEPGTFPLVDGAPARVGRLRGYGNAINAAVAEGFITCAVEAFGLDLLDIAPDLGGAA